MGALYKQPITISAQARSISRATEAMGIAAQVFPDNEHTRWRWWWRCTRLRVNIRWGDTLHTSFDQMDVTITQCISRAYHHRHSNTFVACDYSCYYHVHLGIVPTALSVSPVAAAVATASESMRLLLSLVFVAELWISGTAFSYYNHLVGKTRFEDGCLWPFRDICD